MAAVQPETHDFQAEVQQVLQLVIHSLYSNRDIFLRELISNASDACDKLRFQALQDSTLLADQPDLHIEIEADAEARTLTVRDTGVGMSREELLENLGTIARSGTKRFLEALSEGQKADASLIGQFGVGFYSAFIVADQVSVISRRAGDAQAWIWRSSGDGQFTVAPGPDDAPRGTAVQLHLREGEDAYLDDWKLRSLVRTYSDHIGFPIRMHKAAGDDAPDKDWETVNHSSALWTLPKSEISDDDYQAFYKHVAHDFGDALAWTHNRVEGNQNFTSLLYIPAKAPFDFQYGRDERKGLKLYIKRVFITDASESMLPGYLRFVRGVLDSDDLPLNVSRETLQNNRQVERIKGALTKRVLDLLDRTASEDRSRYDTFWREFGNVLKEGVSEDFANRERVLKLLRYPSTRSASADQWVSLDDYLSRVVDGQDEIYYLTADSWNAAANSPQLEALKARGVEVLLMHERIDEWLAGYLSEYQGKRLRNVAKGEFDLTKLGDPADKAEREQSAKDAEPVLARLKALLGDAVKDVRVSDRLTDSAACLVLEEHDMALHMQRLLQQAGQDAPAAKPNLEINPGHALVRRLADEGDEARAADLGWLLFEQAQLAGGGGLDDPARFNARINRLLVG
ncbi:MAG: molecular chaperone HtpG [Xanthomonadaceae bacterium]|nr:molecular chaperone HtpG [Xanthomonadaceae bacterium]